MIHLKEFMKEDILLLLDWINSESEEHFLQWGGAGAGFTYPLNEEQFLKHFNTSYSDKPIRKIYKAIYNSTNMVGYIELNQINPIHRNAVLSRVLINKAYQGQGIGYEMVKTVTTTAFNEFNLHRLSLGVFDFNIAGYRCYEKVGFVREGITRESMKVGNHYWSSIQMSILEEEWRNKQ